MGKKLITYLVLFCLVVSLVPITVLATGNTVVTVSDNTGLKSITISEGNVEYDYNIYNIENDTYPTYVYNFKYKQSESISISLVSSAFATTNESMHVSLTGPKTNVSKIRAKKEIPQISSDPITVTDGDVLIVYSYVFNDTSFSTNAKYEFHFTNVAFKISKNMEAGRTVYNQGSIATPLEIDAVDPDDRNISYQWQSSINGEYFEDINGATGKTFSPPTDTVEKKMYRVKVTAGEDELFSNSHVIDIQSTVSPSPKYALKSLVISSTELPADGDYYLNIQPWTTNDLVVSFTIPENKLTVYESGSWTPCFYLMAESFAENEKMTYRYVKAGTASPATSSYNSFVDNKTCRAYYMQPGYSPVAQIRVGPGAGSASGTEYTQYSVYATIQSVLSNMELDYQSSPAFTPEVFAYTAQVPLNADEIELRATALTATNVITVNGAEMVNGAITVPVEWESDDTMTISVQVGADDAENGYLAGIYTLTLEKTAPAEKPVIVEDPLSASYIDTETNPTPLTVRASCSGEMTYQWYHSETQDTSGSVPIDGATESSFVPSVAAIEGQEQTSYYYCVVTSQDNGQHTKSGTAAITLYADPTPFNIRIVSANDESPAASAYAYTQDETDVTPLKVLYDNRNTGGDYSFLWSTSTYEAGVPLGVMDQQTYTPGTGAKNKLTLKCTVTCKFNGKSYAAESQTPVVVTINPTSAKAPRIVTSSISSKKIVIGDPVYSMSLTASSLDGGELSYQWYELVDGEDIWVAVEGATESSFLPVGKDEPIIVGYRCRVTNTVTDYDGNSFSAFVDSAVANYTYVEPAAYTTDFEGDGTEESPWLIKNLDDLQKLRGYVNTDGMTFEKCYFRLDLSGSEGIMLPADWTPIGTSSARFAGTIDGAGTLLTVAADGLPLLGYVRHCTVKNLNIYGERIAGYGLVQNYTVDYGPTGNFDDYAQTDSTTVNIINVRLKSGTQTLQSGFIGGYASGINYINIVDCTVEKGVVIGYDRNQSGIGSFAGQFNGTITNSASYATVYGIDQVGGLVGIKGQAMGPCDIYDSEFYGSISASGNYAGGIIGSGYWGNDTAPNTPCVIIQDCLVTGTVSGADYVGGILGGEPGVVQELANGIGRIQNNLFVGTITGSGTNVGGIIGLMNSLNRYTIISNNYFQEGCGTEKGIGKIKTVDKTSAQFGRDDNPTGADADKLTSIVTTAQLKDGTALQKLNSGENSSGTWVQGTSWPERGTEKYLRKIKVTGYQDSYTTDQALNFDSLTVTATYSDGTTAALTSGVTFSGYTQTSVGYQTIKASYTDRGIVYTALFEIRVDRGTDTPSGKITVSFVLIGDTVHDETVTHTYADGSLTDVWIPSAYYELDEGSTVRDLCEMAMTAAGLTWVNEKGNYISSITKGDVTLAEFTNGGNSGWLFMRNGDYPTQSIAQQFLSDGDEIVFHYSDDYTKEDYSMGWTGTIDNQSGSAAKVTVTDAKTGTVTVDCTLACAVIGQKADGSYALLPASVSGNTVTFDASAYTKVIVRIKGDITGDGKVDSSDTLLMKQLVAGIKEPDAITALLLDLTGDGKINSSDTLKMKRVAAGLDSLAW